ncbi:formylglycine-generating enzyme family protein [Schlesneria paludicola]|uniref:formylglycine-generating enzyme family protein n=1 Tax=Schlesneria paludicola TaxID=360056 RepID=UPI000492A030|nr:formylglycine-generating enzyme family protein [Schlesneria paludicola]
MRIGVSHGLFAMLLLALAAPIRGVGDDSLPKREPTQNSIGISLIEIPAGEFLMGAEEERIVTLRKFPNSQPKLLDGELPRHKVRITKAFDMGQYEVTLAQFMTFRDATKYEIEAERDGQPSFGIDPEGELLKSQEFRPWNPIGWKNDTDHPVIYVSWNDAVAFCEWLSQQEGRSYRLPTEAEWEYACRAGSETRFSFGDEPVDLIRFANSNDATRRAKLFPRLDQRKFGGHFLSKSDNYVWTSPVGKFAPNSFGLYDMHGNVWEWCSDFFDKDYYKDSPIDDPKGPGNGESRVLRGGSYENQLMSLRSAIRAGAPASSRGSNTGFRVVRER